MKSFSCMNCWCKDKVKPRDIFTDKYEDFINEIKMYKHYLDEGENILCSSWVWISYVGVNST